MFRGQRVCHRMANLWCEPAFFFMIETALQGLFLGASYLAEKSAKSLTSSYSQSISINNYYNTDLGDVEKTYNEIHIKKYSMEFTGL